MPFTAQGLIRVIRPRSNSRNLERPGAVDGRMNHRGGAARIAADVSGGVVSDSHHGRGSATIPCPPRPGSTQRAEGEKLRRVSQVDDAAGRLLRGRAQQHVTNLGRDQDPVGLELADLLAQDGELAGAIRPHRDAAPRDFDPPRPRRTSLIIAPPGSDRVSPRSRRARRRPHGTDFRAPGDVLQPDKLLRVARRAAGIGRVRGRILRIRTTGRLPWPATRGPLRRRGLPVPRAGRRNDRRLFFDLLHFDRFGQFGDCESAAVDELERQIDAEFLAHPRHQLHRQQGMAAQIEEIVVDAYRADTKASAQISARRRSNSVRGGA